ncbi:MAG: DUF3368 domain-containing protein [Ferruginibacter sp.]
MQKIIVSDTSCLILLDKIGELSLLNKLFGSIITTPEVASEFGKPLPEWITIQKATNKDLQTIMESKVDKGEASAITLAMEMPDCVLIIDEIKGRRIAENLGLNITGTIGILIQANNAGIGISLKSILEKIKKTNFRISENLERLIRNEIPE